MIKGNQLFLNGGFNMTKRIGLIMGDAAGIGPEIIIKTIENSKKSYDCDLVVIGSFKIMSLMQKFDSLGVLNRNNLPLVPIYSI
jgi:4-hydroxy-L-threonine phosphate dehydrogenase PdxA